MTDNVVERIVEICKLKGIPVSKMEKDLGFGNGSLNPAKASDIKSARLLKVLKYLNVSFEEFYEIEKPVPNEEDGTKPDSNVDERHAYVTELFDQLSFQNQIRAAIALQSLLQNQLTQDESKESE